MTTGKHHTTVAVPATSLQNPSKAHPHNVPKSQLSPTYQMIIVKVYENRVSYC